MLAHSRTCFERYNSVMASDRLSSPKPDLAPDLAKPSWLLSPLARRVLFALAYTDQFLYPLTLLEVWKRTPGRHSLAQVAAALKELGAQKLVERNTAQPHSEYFALVGNQEITEVRRQRFLEAARFLPAIEEACQALRNIPFVQGIALTGSLSMQTAQPGDDIDLLVITSPGTLWVTRLWAVLLASSKGRRRFWWEDQTWLGWKEQPSLSQSVSNQPSKEKAKWCLNLWLTTNALAVPAHQRSIYTAYEVVQARFIFSRPGVIERFLRANRWVERYLPMYWHSAVALLNNSTDQNLEGGKQQPNLLITSLNTVLYWIQRWYMSSHMTQEKVALDMAYFHPRPTAHLITQGWQAALQRVIAFRVSSFQKLAQKPVAKAVREQLAPEWQLPPALQSQLDKARQQKQKVVLVTGVFDILHRAHRQFLIQAKMKGDFLIVGIESDLRVTALKGPGRPINSAAKRQKQTEALEIVDVVFVLPEQFSNRQDHIHLIQLIKPAVLAVSAHTPYIESKQAILAQVGGRVEVVMEHDKSISTTQLIEQMKA